MKCQIYFSGYPLVCHEVFVRVANGHAVPKLFIGMDVHKKSWTVHFKTDLFDNKTISIRTDPDEIINYVQKHFESHQVSCCL